jgi:predicted  nucleic acid-binding Zn-ribbon protein
LRVVKRGLDQAFEKSKPNRPVRRLSYCRQTVEANYRRFREAVAGARQEGTEEAAEPTDVQAHLGRLQAELVRAREKVDASRAPLGAAIDRAARSLAALASEPTYPTPRLDELEQELDRLEGALMEAAESVLGPSDRQRLLDEAERSLRDYRGRMPSDVLQSALRAAYLKRVRALFELPALSLFYL